ncbi:DUF4270 domain-containing protein [Flavobacterium sp. DGU11]|uniref:DUF4270 domain-containing protein n=1 Tax=Flavobacterium arundinis TaxID=3139143 RepID=A0ABU9HX05_9FLAO
MINSSFLKKILFALSAVFIISCDTDYNTIGSDIINDDVHHGMFKLEAGVVAYDRPTGIVQSNNLNLNTLGAYDNPVFGKTVAHFVTQVQLATVNPTLYAPEIDSVYLYVPYFSSVENTDASTGVSTYDLDSIYGAPETKIKLDVFRNGYFLRDSDPGTSFVSGQKYYSNDKSLIDAAIVGSRLNNFSEAQNDQFPVSDDEIARSAIPDGQTESKVVERKAPGIFLYLDKTEFQNMLFGPSAAGKLVNNNIFKEYFRGLYFRVQQIEGQSVMVVPRFDQGTITIKYRDHNISTATNAVNGHTPDKFAKSMTLNLDGNTINFFENTPNPNFSAAVGTSDPVLGDEKLYLKGGEGSMAFIDIDQATIDALKAENQGGQRVLVNEANLLFYLDEASMAGAVVPNRVFLYDVNNKRPLIDYSLDATTTTVNPKYDKLVHGGLLVSDDDPNDPTDDNEPKNYRYKVRITDHINNLINKDSTNVKLGLVVTEYINLTGNAALKSPFTENSGATAPVTVSTVPVSSVMHPFGTILFGSNPAVPDNKRLKLEIFYTKPN